MGLLIALFIDGTDQEVLVLSFPEPETIGVRNLTTVQRPPRSGP